MKTYFKPTLLAVGLALVAGPAAALDVYLAAKPFTKTLPMSGGTPVDVPMWGYVEDTGGTCYNTADAAARVACVDALPAPAVPGLRIKVAPTDPALTIHLTNALPEPTSIVIPGQSVPAGGPTWDDNSTGPRGTDLNKKVRSFGAETPAGGTGSYSWTLDRPGTFVYHSGTHPQKQVYMGLYGALTRDAVAADPLAVPPVAAVAYNDPADGLTPLASTTYDQEVMLFYSDIDPVINNAINDGSYTTSVDFNAQWFLVNGEPYDPANKADQAMTIPAGAANSRTLVRFLSAASETHVPTLQGLYMTLHAEDGLVYNYQDATGAHAAPRTHYSVHLPPLKTKDAIMVPQLAGTYAVYDGNGYMTNPSDINDFNVGDTVGGMLRFLSVGGNGNQPPVVVDDSATVVEGRSVAINVLANDSDPEGQPLTIASVDTTGTVGTVGCDTTNPGGSCNYTADGGVGITTFTYAASDGVQTNDPPDATVTVTVVANGVPVAVDDPDALTDEGVPVEISVLANDTDPENDPLAIASFDSVALGLGGTVSCVTTPTTGGTCIYTPPATGTGTATFTYTTTDGSATSTTPATVTVTVNPAAGNTPPVANDDDYTIGEDTALNVAAPGVLGNDIDTDPLTAVLVTNVTHGTLTLNANGSFRYVPALNYNGFDSFTYVANDGTVDGNTATVTIDVTPVNDAPVAVDDTFYLNSMVTTNVAARGVLTNDTDIDTDPGTLTAVLDAFNNDAAGLTLNTDGGFAYTADPGNVGVGTLDTFTYFANDGAVNSTLPGAVTLTRKLSVIQAVCERRPNGRCDWRISGDKLSAGGRVEAWVGGFDTGTRIGRTGANTPAGAWSISVNNSQVNTGLGPIDFRVTNDAVNATILGYTPTEQ